MSLSSGGIRQHNSDLTRALKGESLSSNLVTFANLNDIVVRCCIIHGIRHHLDFATSEAVITMCIDNSNGSPEYARARNARLLMSNIIPEFSPDSPELVPYCIWYPDVPSEETCRQVAWKYPFLRYHVGRVCAVAGYTHLFRELDLLPDTTIAHEALDRGQKSLDIYRLIVSQPVRYTVMDDHTLSVHLDDPQAGSFMNGEACVVSTLRVTQSLEEFENEYPRTTREYFDICEDMGIAEKTAGDYPPKLTAEESALLYNPLPQDLPTTNKDLLILMAAYYGNIDRYARLRRLRRPMIAHEFKCVVRGIYHSVPFAKWWSEEIDRLPERKGIDGIELNMAITARFIMSNDVSRVKNELPARLPYFIWYPQLPRMETLAELSILQSKMLPQILHSCIVGNYQDLYDHFKGKVPPNRLLWGQARKSGNKHYLTDLESRAKEQDIDLSRFEGTLGIYKDLIEEEMEPTTTMLKGRLCSSDVDPSGGQPGGIYGGLQPTSSRVDLFICAPEGLRQIAENDEHWGYVQVYNDSLSKIGTRWQDG